jgi:hypothetical protein
VQNKRTLALGQGKHQRTEVWLWTWYQVESFHENKRLLNEMRAVQRESTNNSAPAREALLQILPLGTDREAAVAVLRSEGFGCQTIAEPITDTRLRHHFIEARQLASSPNDSRTRKDLVDCQVRSPSVIGYKRWIVDLEFNADGHLSEVGIAIWNNHRTSATEPFSVRLPSCAVQ